ncbi:MAG: hypothetical protein HKN85_10805 [Gammaproteobacteria bacterium]|nr:hypothetical protein [Gammaproteobacteria bacterium]
MTSYQSDHDAQSVQQSVWLSVLKRYILFVALANLGWEFLQLPLYTIWESGTYSEIVFAAVHCTGGDILIALSAIVMALFLAGNSEWPIVGFKRVMIVTIVFGLGYTIFSEWLNIEVRKAWAYSDLMPVVPIINTGLSPIVQWILIPAAGFNWSLRKL